MHRTLAAAVLGAAVAAGTPARADHFMATADPAVVQGINEIVMLYGQACRIGYGDACQMAQMAQQQGYAMLNAGYDCQLRGIPQACGYYRQTYATMSNQLGQLRQAQTGGMIGQASGAGVDPLGATHQERMSTIEAWGQSRLQWGQQQSQLMDQRHDAFMETLRK